MKNAITLRSLTVVALIATIPQLGAAAPKDKESAPVAAASFYTPKVGERVLCSDYTENFNVCQVKAIEGEKITAEIGWGADRHNIKIEKGFVFPYDWKVGTKVSCMKNGGVIKGGDGHEVDVNKIDPENPIAQLGIAKGLASKSSEIAKISGDKLRFKVQSNFDADEAKMLESMGGPGAMTEVNKAEGAGDEEDTDIHYCAQGRDVHPSIYWKMSPLFRAFDAFAVAAGMPAAGMKDASLANSGRAGVNGSMGQWDGAKYIQLKNCVVLNSSWSYLSSGSEKTGRQVNLSCGMQLWADKCVLSQQTCHQAYEGKNDAGVDIYAGCENIHNTAVDVKKIACTKI